MIGDSLEGSDPKCAAERPRLPLSTRRESVSEEMELPRKSVRGRMTLGTWPSNLPPPRAPSAPRLPPLASRGKRRGGGIGIVVPSMGSGFVTHYPIPVWVPGDHIREVCRRSQCLVAEYGNLISATSFLRLASEKASCNQSVFRARVNRSLLRKYERRQQERREGMRSTKRVGPYANEEGQAGVPETVSPERSHQFSARSPKQGAKPRNQVSEPEFCYPTIYRATI